MKKRFVAVLCIVTMVFASIGSYIGDLATVFATEGGYKELTFSDWGIIDGEYTDQKEYDVLDTSITSMDGVALSGMLTASENAVLYIGGQSGWAGLLTQITTDTNGQEILVISSNPVEGYKGLGTTVFLDTIRTALNNDTFTLLNNEFLLRMTFDVDGDNNLQLGIYINNVYITTVDFNNGIATALGTKLLVYLVSGTLTLADSRVIYQDGVLTVKKEGALSAADLSEALYKDATNIIIEAGITEIASSTFDGFNNLTEVYLPNTVNKVAEDAFVNCPEGVTLRYAVGKEFTGGLVNPDIHPYYSFKCLTIGSSYGEDTNTYIYKLAKTYFASLEGRAEGDSAYDEIVIAELFTGGGTLAQRVQAIMGTPNASCYYEKWDENGISVPTTPDGELSSELMTKALNDEYWDTVILMQSADDSAKPESFETKTNGVDADIDAVIAFAKANNKNNENSKYYWLQTWSYNYKLNDSDFANACTYSETMRQNIVTSMTTSVQARVDSGELSGIIPAGAGLENLKGSCINVADPTFDYTAKPADGKLYNNGNWSSLFAIQRDTAHASCGLGRFTLGLTAFSYLAGLTDTEIEELSNTCYPKSLAEYEITDKLAGEQSATGAYLGYEEATKEAAPHAAYAAINAIANPYEVLTDSWHPHEDGECPLCQVEDTEEESAYRELTFSDWNVPLGSHSSSPGKFELLDTTITSLDGVAFNATVKTGGQAVFYIGDTDSGGWGGIMVNIMPQYDVIQINSGENSYPFNSGKGVDIAEATIQQKLNDTEFSITDEYKIRVTFSFYEGNNVEVGVYINDTYIQTVDFNNGITAALGTTLYVYNPGGDLTLQDARNYRELSFSDWGVPTGDYNAGTSGPYYLTDTSITSMDGVAFNGTMSATGATSVLYIGGSGGNWDGVMVYMGVSSSADYLVLGTAETATYTKIEQAVTTVGGSAFSVKTDFKFRITFDFYGENNVLATLYINDTYVTRVNYSNGMAATMGTELVVYETSGSVLTIQDVIQTSNSGTLSVNYRAAGGSTSANCTGGLYFDAVNTDFVTGAAQAITAVSGAGKVLYNGNETTSYSLMLAYSGARVVPGTYRFWYTGGTPAVGDTLTISGTFGCGTQQVIFEETTFKYLGTIGTSDNGTWKVSRGGYQELTFSDWNVPQGVFPSTSSVSYDLTDTTIISLDEVAFSGMLTIPEGTGGDVFYIGGKDNGWKGILVQVLGTGEKIYINSSPLKDDGYTNIGTTVQTSDIQTALGDSSFSLLDTFELALTFDFYGENHILLGVYVNNTYVTSFNFNNSIAAALGTKLLVYPVTAGLEMEDALSGENLHESGTLTVHPNVAGNVSVPYSTLLFQTEDTGFVKAVAATGATGVAKLTAVKGLGKICSNDTEISGYTFQLDSAAAGVNTFRLAYSGKSNAVAGDTLTVEGIFCYGDIYITFEKTTFMWMGYTGGTSGTYGWWMIQPEYYESGTLTVHPNVAGNVSVPYSTLLFQTVDTDFVKAVAATGATGVAKLTALEGMGKIYSNDTEISGYTLQLDSAAAGVNTFRLAYSGKSDVAAGDTLTVEGVFYFGENAITIEKTTFIWMGYTGGTSGTYGWWMLESDVLPEENAKEILEESGYTRVTVPEFGAMTYRSYTATDVHKLGNYIWEDTLDKTYLDVNVTFTSITSTSDGYIRYGSSDGWHCVNISSDGTRLTIGLESISPMTTILPQEVGLNSFDNVNIKIALDCGTFTTSTDGTNTYNVADYTVSIWVNNRKVVDNLTKTGQIYAGASLAVYVADTDATDEAITLDMDYEDVTRDAASYNLEDGNYLVSGSSAVLKNGIEVTLTDYAISTPGDYEVITTVEDERIYYHKNVAIYKLGDVDLNGTAAEESDLAALEAIYTSTSYAANSAAEKAADLDNDGMVDAEDWKLMKQILAATDPATELEAVKDKYHVAAKSYDYLGGDDVMPIVGYFGPFNNGSSTQVSDFLSAHYFSLVQKTGINLVSYSQNSAAGTDDLHNIKKTLKYADKYQLGWYLYDTSLNSAVTGQELTTEQFATALGKYAYFDSFLGNMIVDEPVYEKSAEAIWLGNDNLMSNYTAISERLNKYGNLTGHINLAPEDSKLVNGLTDDYFDEYIDQYVDESKPQILSIDDYPFNDDADEGVTDAGGYFRSLTKIREQSVEHDIPFWWYVQSGGNFKDTSATDYTYNADLAVTKEETYWNVNTALAFGAKGIEWFTLIQPWYYYDTDNTEQLNGLIDAQGNATKFYNYATAINTHITNVDEVLMKAESKGVITTGGYAASQIAAGVQGNTDQNSSFVSPIITASDTSRLKSVTSVDATTGLADDYGTIVGCFDYRDSEAYYVVNYNVTTGTNQKVTLELDDEYNYRVIQQGASAYSVIGTTCELTIPAGEAVLVVLDGVAGDANGDGIFDSRDLVRHKRIEAEEVRVEFAQGYDPDLNVDDIIDKIDTKWMRYYLALSKFGEKNITI